MKQTTDSMQSELQQISKVIAKTKNQTVTSAYQQFGEGISLKSIEIESFIIEADKLLTDLAHNGSCANCTDDCNADECELALKKNELYHILKVVKGDITP